MSAASNKSVSVGTEVKRELKTQAVILLGFIALIWAIELVDFVVFSGGLDSYGIHPRSANGLVGILLAPLLHGGFDHLIANTGPLLVLGWFVMLRETRDIFVVATIGTVVGGLGVWLIGASNSVHIGANIVVFAFLGYLLVRGFMERRVLPIIGSLIVAFLYGGALWGVLPGTSGVSWEGHLFGFIGGILAARLMVKGPLRDKPLDAAR